MNNKTIERIEIKKRGDNVYDVYVNKEHIAYAGSFSSAMEKLNEYIEREGNQNDYK